MLPQTYVNIADTCYPVLNPYVYLFPNTPVLNMKLNQSDVLMSHDNFSCILFHEL